MAEKPIKLIICKRCKKEKKHQAKGLCHRCYNLFFYHKKNPNAGYLNRWALHYDKCIKCGTTKIKHIEKGLCKLCYKNYKKNYDLLYRIKNKNKIIKKYKKWYHQKGGKKWKTEYNKKWIKNNIEKVNITQNIWRKKNKDKVSEIQKRYYDKYSKQILSKHKIYQIKRKKEIKIYALKYYKINKEKIAKREKIYFQKNKIKRLEYTRNWRKKNPIKTLSFALKYRSQRNLKSKGFLTTYGITKKIINQALKESDGYCVYCSKKIYHYTFDHIIPVLKCNPNIHKFNPNNIDNIVIACKSCNSSKGSKSIDIWCKEKNIEVPNIIVEKLGILAKQTKIGDTNV